ncbi:hypothetical protein [Desulfovibrio ferrophilus]|uniref:Uncharacterized protein n=1 Tax=Desulfovibrio ferrophilus TaxID=241368 RepID=A0A2Z6AX45_9BACT|nr:hypothetical protein [Desulfovibrio ferrophilus]BBD07773.1 uncharacterized protein DFE_1047 [Desulfovibrio ferrophilus]
MGIYEKLLELSDAQGEPAARTISQEKIIKYACMVTQLSQDLPDQIIQKLQADSEIRTDFFTLVNGCTPDDDTQNARSLMKTLQNTSLGKAPVILSIIITSGFFLVLILVILSATLNLNLGGNKELVYLLVGTMTAGFTQVLNFWLGSSKGSSDKMSLLFHQFSKKPKTDQ